MAAYRMQMTASTGLETDVERGTRGLRPMLSRGNTRDGTQRTL
jgi:hypothetical protein